MDSLALANGSSYQFTYDAYARLTLVTLPTGGTYQYSYPGSNGGYDCSYDSAFPFYHLRHLVRTVDATSQWTFDAAPVSSGSGDECQGLVRTTVVDPTQAPVSHCVNQYAQEYLSTGKGVQTRTCYGFFNPFFCTSQNAGGTSNGMSASQMLKAVQTTNLEDGSTSNSL